MYINVIKTLPKKLYVAYSGGVDSTAMVLKALEGRRNVTLAFFYHGNEYADEEEQFVRDISVNLGLDLEIGRGTHLSTGSKEKNWRDARYAFFHQLPGLVATGHTLDDAVEWYLMTSLWGQGRFMSYSNGNVVRPLLRVTKDQILTFVKQSGVEWLEDRSNSDPDFTMRNRIRSTILPECLAVNPGLYSLVKKRLHLDTEVSD